MNEQKKPLLFISQVFDPEPQLKGRALIDKLSDQFDIKVCAATPNYPGGKIYKGYRNHLRSEVTSNFAFEEVRRFIFPTRSKNFVLRFCSYLSFALGAVHEIWISRHRFKIVYVCMPPIPSVFLALLMCRFCGMKIIYDVQDVWPEVFFGSDLISENTFFGRGLDAACSWIYSKCDLLLVQSQNPKVQLVGKGVAEERIRVIYNWAFNDPDIISRDENRVALDDIYYHEGNYDVRIIYSGNVGLAQDLFSWVSMFADKDINSHIRLDIIGAGVALGSIKNFLKRNKIQNIRVFEPVSPSEISEIYKNYDFGLVTLKNSEWMSGIIPAKFQGYLAEGLPVLSDVCGELGCVLETHSIGVSAYPRLEDKHDVTNRMQEFLDSLANKESFKKIYRKNFSFQAGSEKFFSVLREMNG